MIDDAAFKTVLGSFPSGVVIATTLDADNMPWGFTATSFSSVSLNPPLVLISLATKAACHRIFKSARHLSINVLRSGDELLARRFGTPGVSKFCGAEFVAGPQGLPLLRNALATLVCRKYVDYECGDHSMIVGQVYAVRGGPDGDAMVYYRRDFWRFDSANERLCLITETPTSRPTLAAVAPAPEYRADPRD
jgi:flavin reductase ActVB